MGQKKLCSSFFAADDHFLFVAFFWCVRVCVLNQRSVSCQLVSKNFIFSEMQPILKVSFRTQLFF